MDMAIKSQEVSVEGKLRALYNLQLIDSRIDEINLFINNLPLEVQQLNNEVTDIQSKSYEVQQEIEVFENNIQEKKNIIKDAETFINKYRIQQNKIRNNREFESLNKEIEYQELEIELSNKRIREYQLAITEKKELSKKLDLFYKEKQKHVIEKQKEFDCILQNYKQQHNNLSEKAILFSNNIEPRLLQLYKRIRSRSKNGLAIVPVERGASGGSFFTIPPQKCLDIAQRKKIVIDEHSGRILVDSDLADEERQKNSFV